MRTRTILAALGTGVLAALTLSAPASATGPMSSPTVDWKAQCDKAGSVSVTFTAPTEANKDNHVFVQVGGNQGSLPTSSGERTITFKFANTAALTAQWANGGTTSYADVEANAHYTWSLPDTCKPTVEIVKPTCAIPYLSVVVSNPVGAAPISLTMNGDTVSPLNGGENDGKLKTSHNVTYSYHGLGDLSPYITGGATIDYAPPTGCSSDTPGGQQIVPETGTHHHGRGRFDPKTVTVVTAETTTKAPAGAVTTTKTTTKAAAAGKGDNLAVTGSNTKAIVGVGFLLFAGGLVLLLAIRRRRQVRFTA